MKENPHIQKFIGVSRDFPILFLLMVLSSAILILLLMDINAYAQSVNNSSDTVPLSAFIGSWENNNSKGISKAIVQQVDGGELRVHLFGACVPDYCDWGVVNATYTHNVILSRHTFPFKTSSAILSLTNDGNLKVDVTNRFKDVPSGSFTDSFIGLQEDPSGRFPFYASVDILSKTPEFGLTSNDPIRGVPYPITLSNNGTATEYDMEYKVRLSFVGEDNRYNISSVDKGAFDSYDILSSDTVVFYARTLAENEKKSGIVVFQFQNGSAEKHRQLEIDASLTSMANSYYNNDIVVDHYYSLPTYKRPLSPEEPSAIAGTAGEAGTPGGGGAAARAGAAGEAGTPGGGGAAARAGAAGGDVVTPPPSPTGSISFTVDASFFEVLISVTKIAPEVFKLASDVYDKITPCAALEIQDADMDSSNPVIYKIDINNCSTHPQKINLILTLPSGQQQITHLLSKRVFDIGANRTDSSTLEIYVPAGMPNNFYPFTMHADVIMNVFGKEFIVSSSLADESFQVAQARVYP